MLFSVGFLCASFGFAQDGDKPFSEENLVKHIVSQMERQYPQENRPLQDVVLQAVTDGDTDSLDALKYNKEVLSFLPTLRDEKGNNVFHLAKDENVVQVLAFILRNADNKTGGADNIKMLLEQPNPKGQTPVFKALLDGKLNVYKMYGMFLDLPRNMKKAVSAQGAERDEARNKIEKHVKDRSGQTLLDAAERALVREENKEAAQPEKLNALDREIKALEVYANDLF